MLCPALGSQQPNAGLQAGGRVVGKLPGGKGSRVAVGQWLNISQQCGLGGQEGQ